MDMWREAGYVSPHPLLLLPNETNPILRRRGKKSKIPLMIRFPKLVEKEKRRLADALDPYGTNAAYLAHHLEVPIKEIYEKARQSVSQFSIIVKAYRYGDQIQSAIKAGFPPRALWAHYEPFVTCSEDTIKRRGDLVTDILPFVKHDDLFNHRSMFRKEQAFNVYYVSRDGKTIS